MAEGGPDNTAVRTALWRALHLEVDAPPYVLEDRIGLQLASSAHPKYAVNLGTGGDQTIKTDGVIARNRVFHDRERPSRLLLRIG